jgi:hypothetical protein
MDAQNQHNSQGTGSSDEEGRPGPARLISIQIVWGALLATVVVYVATAYLVISGDNKSAAATDLGTLELLLAVMSLSTLGLSFVIPKKILGKAIGSDDPDALTIEQLSARAFSPWIIRLAMSESVALFGFVAAMVSHQPSKILPFAVLSALAMLMALPSDRSLRLAARSAIGR